MNIFRAYFSGFAKAARMPRPVLLIYSLNLILALLIVFPMSELLHSSLGQSTNAAELIKGFRMTIFADFLRTNALAFQAILSSVKWILLIYWLASVFFAGGILQGFSENKFSMAAFFRGAGFHFFRFLGISILVLLMHVLFLLLVWVPVILIINIHIQSGDESAIRNSLLIGAGIYIFLLIFALAVNDYAKIYGFTHQTNSFKAFGGGLKYVWSHFGKAYLLYLMLLLLPAALIFGYFKADAEIDTRLRYGIIFSVLLQQAFIILRIWFRMWIYASPFVMLRANEDKNEIQKFPPAQSVSDDDTMKAQD